MPDTPLEAALAFVVAINAGDLTALRDLMTEDHTFTDPLGNNFSGAEAMISGWRDFLHAFPEYRIDIRHTVSDAIFVGLFGRASGKRRTGASVSAESWSVSAAWLVEVESGRVRHWTVFCDTSWANPAE